MFFDSLVGIPGRIFEVFLAFKSHLNKNLIFGAFPRGPPDFAGRGDVLEGSALFATVKNGMRNCSKILKK